MKIKNNSNIVKELSRVEIQEMTSNKPPYLMTNQAFVFGQDANLEEIMTISLVAEKDCAGHFGPKVQDGVKNLKIPLLHLSRIMIISCQLVARLKYPDRLPIPVKAVNIRANNQNLISPPATVTAVAKEFQFFDSEFRAKAFSKANGEPYAEMGELLFTFIPGEDFKREAGSAGNSIPDILLRDYEIIRELYHSEIEDMIIERQPFHHIDKALMLRSKSGDIRLITISRISEQDCDGQFVINGNSTILSTDYAKMMALTAELLASILTREKFGLSVVPIAVKVDVVHSSKDVFFSPPATIITEASITARAFEKWHSKKFFSAEKASVWINDTEVSRLDNILYALVPEDDFLKM